MGGSLNPVKIVKKVLKPVVQALAPDMPDQQQQTATVVQPAAAAAQAAPTVTAAQDSETVLSSAKALRKGKKSVTVSRTTSSGTGLNV